MLSTIFTLNWKYVSIRNQFILFKGTGMAQLILFLVALMPIQLTAIASMRPIATQICINYLFKKTRFVFRKGWFVCSIFADDNGDEYAPGLHPSSTSGWG